MGVISNFYSKVTKIKNEHSLDEIKTKIIDVDWQMLLLKEERAVLITAKYEKEMEVINRHDS